MARFIRRQNLSNRENKKLIKLRVPFDVNANFINQAPEIPLKIEVSSKNFSFKDNALQMESLQNPNIVDSQEFDRIRNSKLELTDKFDNQSDPFFDLDDSIDIVYSPKKIRNNSLNKITKKIKNSSSPSRYKV